MKYSPTLTLGLIALFLVAAFSGSQLITSLQSPATPATPQLTATVAPGTALPTLDATQLAPDQQAALNAYPLDAGTNQHYVAGELLVTFRPGTAADRITQALNNEHLQEKTRDHLSALLDKINTKTVSIPSLPDQANPQALINRLKNQADVATAQLNYVYPLALTPNDAWYFGQWHLLKIGAPTAWDTTTGSPNISMAILDSGVDATHPDLMPNLVPGWNVYDNNNNTSDVVGHGTAVAGVAGAVGNNSIGVAGVTWSAKIMPLRVTNIYGITSDSVLASGLIWASDHGARVANMSVASSNLSAPLTSAAQYFHDHNGVVILAAGNSGTVLTDPNNPYLLNVSATDTYDQLASFSNTGTLIDLAAPGVSLYTTKRGGGYTGGTGTSFAAPVVAGTAALVMAANPALTADQVSDILKRSASDLGSAGWDPNYGWGRVDVARAVQLARSPLPPPPALELDTTPPQVTITNPVANSTIVGSINFTATVTDPAVAGQTTSGIAEVNFYRDNILIVTDTTAPYSANWDTRTVSNGSHNLSALAEDNAGNSASRTITINVNNQTTQPTLLLNSYSVSTTASSATVTWLTNVPSTGVVNYGTSRNNLNLSQTDPNFTTSHRLTLPNLQPKTRYYYQIRAVSGSQSLTSPVSSFQTKR